MMTKLKNFAPIFSGRRSKNRRDGLQTARDAFNRHQARAIETKD